MTATEPTAKILVCWDVDLTLIQGGGFSLEVIRVAFHRHTGYWPDALPDMPGRTDRAISLDLLAMHHRPVDELDGYLAHLQAAAADLTDRLKATGSVMPGALEATRALAADGRVLAQTLVTGNMRPNAQVKLSTLGANRHIDFSIGGYGDTTVHRHELVETARTRAQNMYTTTIPVSHVVVLGDTPKDIAAARKAGARCVGVATGHHRVNDLAAADAVLVNLVDTEAVLRAVIDRVGADIGSARYAGDVCGIAAVEPGLATRGDETDV